MDKLVIRRWLLEALLAIIVLVVPFFLIFMGTFMMPALVSFWATALVLMRNVSKQNPEIVQSTKYLMFEKLLYFQIINIAFALFFFPLFMLVAIVTVVVLLGLLFKTRKEPSLKVIKWAKYTGLHIFNWILLFILSGLVDEVSYEMIIFVMPMITFINGMQAAFFMKLEQVMFAGGRKLIALLIVLVMIGTTTWRMFPR